MLRIRSHGGRRNSQRICVMTHKTFASAPIDETRLHVLPFKAPPVRPDTRHDQLVNLAAGENDAAETARADVWSEFGIEYGCPAVEAQEEYA